MLLAMSQDCPKQRKAVFVSLVFVFVVVIANIQTITGLSQWEADTEHFLRDVQDVLPCRRCRQVLRERLQDI